MEPVARAAGAARRYVRSRLEQLDALDLENAAELGVSELVANAVLHGRTAVTVTVRRLASGRVRIDVADGSPLPPARRPVRLLASTGRGLRMVASVSVAWGVDDLRDRGQGKSVWFEPSAGATAAADRCR